jgi:hypothetical protein
MVTITLPEELDDKFWTLIPAHRELITQLMNNEIVVSYAINSSRTSGWIVVSAETREEAIRTIKKFPIYSYYLDVEIEELFLFDTSYTGLPKLVLN